MSNLNSRIAFEGRAVKAGGGRAAALGGLLAAISLVGAGVSQAQSAPAPSGSAPPQDNSLTWHGITLYGIVDVGLQYDTHSAPFSDYFMASSGDVVQKNSNNAVSGLTSNNLSQSRVGLQGKEALNFMDWSAVFKLETFFNPTSGNISDAVKSLTQNNGKPLAATRHQHRFERGGSGIPAVIRGIELTHLRHDHLRSPEHADGGRHREV